LGVCSKDCMDFGFSHDSKASVGVLGIHLKHEEFGGDLVWGRGVRTPRLWWFLFILCNKHEIMKLLRLTRANDNKHKYTAVLEHLGRSYHMSFGAKGYSDYTLHKGPERKGT
jgi:hypothetical protein